MDSTSEMDYLEESMVVPETQEQNISKVSTSNNQEFMFDDSIAVIPASDEEYDSDGENDPYIATNPNIIPMKKSDYKSKSETSAPISSLLPATVGKAQRHSEGSVPPAKRKYPSPCQVSMLSDCLNTSGPMIIDVTDNEHKDWREVNANQNQESPEVIELSDDEDIETSPTTAPTMAYSSKVNLLPLHRPSPSQSRIAIETSTPLLSTNRKQFRPFEELNITAIDKPESNLNLTNQSDSSSDSLNDVAASLHNLSLHKPIKSATEQVSKQNGVQDLPQASVVNISSDLSSDEFSSCLVDPKKDRRNEKKATKKANTIVEVDIDTDDESWNVDESESSMYSFEDEVVEVPHKPSKPKPTAAANAPGPSSAAREYYNKDVVMYEFKSSVEKAIQSFVNIIDGMPVAAECEDAMKRPKYLLVDLYKHQKYGLEWLLWREEHFPGGGILADEMGLGKTVMIIGLVLKSKEDKKRKPEEQNEWYKETVGTKKLVPSRSTLVVCPAGLIKQWETELKTKVGRVTVLSFHGPKRHTSPAVLAQHDFVLTTYPTIANEIPKDVYTSSPLARIHWERVVLDEGHIVRNMKTKAAHAVGVLHANHRWVVTGTPVHNSAADMFSLISFLRLAPFNDKKVWEHWIGSKAITPDAAARLHTISKCLLLRRTKDEVNLADPTKQIPPKEVVDKEVELSERERLVYDHLKEFAAEKFKNFLKNAKMRQTELQSAGDNFVSGGRKGRRDAREVNFTHIFSLILRLRQASVLPYLIHTMLEDENENSDLDSSLPEEGEVLDLKNPCFSKEFKSAKVTQLLEDIDAIKFISEQTGEKMDKVVVISQWTKLLDILNYHLREAGYSTDFITGKQTLDDRDATMKKVNSTSSRPQVLLLSLMAGGVGLNLVGANHVFFMDVHWNPQLELQAQDRVHRFGQTKNVSVTRYISKDTMDERVVMLQNQKLDLAAGILSSSKNQGGGGLNLNQMRLLFDL